MSQKYPVYTREYVIVINPRHPVMLVTDGRGKMLTVVETDTQPLTRELYDSERMEIKSILHRETDKYREGGA